MLALLPTPATAAYSTSSVYADFFATERLGSAPSTRRSTGDTWNMRLALPSSQPEQLTTQDRLLLTRIEKLLPIIWQDWQAKQACLTGIVAEEALMRIGLLLLTVPLAASALSAGFTFEQSLYVRAELPGQAGGTLYVEVNLGDEADVTEDSFASIRQNKQEKWSRSGPFVQVIAELRAYFSAVAQRIEIDRAG